jgi:formate hydrogenlyase subunit 3/multisubunit Na+/H+ antiporter MnhD subunit
MDLRRLSAGDWIAGASGVALLVSLFLPWYELDLCAVLSSEAGESTGCPTRSGWESLAALDVLLALVAATAVALPLITATQRVPAVPIALAAVVTLVGLFGVVLVLIRVLDIPNWAFDREWGLWLALASSVGIVAGGCVAMRAEHWPGEAEPVETMPTPQP